MKGIGIEPCKPFDATKLDAATQNALPKLALTKIEAMKDKAMGAIVDGWKWTKSRPHAHRMRSVNAVPIPDVASLRGWRSQDHGTLG